jgi:hypothetical protein
VIQIILETARKREIEGLLDAARSYDLKAGLILTESTEDEIHSGNIRIRVRPVWKWMLE